MMVTKSALKVVSLYDLVSNNSTLLLLIAFNIFAILYEWYYTNTVKILIPIINKQEFTDYSNKDLMTSIINQNITILTIFIIIFLKKKTLNKDYTDNMRVFVTIVSSSAKCFIRVLILGKKYVENNQYNDNIIYNKNNLSNETIANSKTTFVKYELINAVNLYLTFILFMGVLLTLSMIMLIVTEKILNKSIPIIISLSKKIKFSYVEHSHVLEDKI